MSAFDLGIVFTARDLASSQMNGLKHSFMELDEGIQQSQKNFGKYAAAFTAGLGIMVAGAKTASVPLSFLETAGDFQKSLAAMRIASGYTTESMAIMEKKAIELGVATQFSPDEAVLAMKQIASSGYDAATTLKIVGGAVAFAGASMGDLKMDEASAVVVAALRSFKLAATDSEHIADILTRTTQISNVTFRDFDRIIAGAGDTAKSANQSIETLLASVGMMKLQGGTATAATEAFRMALTNIQKPTAQKGLDMIGVKAQELYKDGNLIGLPDILDKVTKGLEGIKAPDLNTKKIMQIEALGNMFGVEGVKAYNKLMGSEFVDASGKALQGTDALRAAIKDLVGQQKTAKAANEAYLETYAGLKDLLAGTLQTIKVVLGKQLLEDASKGIGFFLGYLNMFLGKLQESPAMAAVFSKGILAIGVALMGVGALISGFAGFAMLKALFITAGISISGVLGSIGTAIAAAFWPVTIATALIVGAVLAWQNNFLGFRDFVSGFVSGIMNNISAFAKHAMIAFDFSGFIESMQPYVQVLKEVFTELASAVGQVFSGMDIFGASKDLAGAAQSGTAFGDVLRGVIQPAAQILSAALAGAVKVVTWLIQGFNEWGATGRNVVLGILAVIPGLGQFIAIGLLIANNWNFLSGVFSSVLGVLQSVGNAFLDFAFNIPVWIAAGVSAVQILWVQLKAGAMNAINAIGNGIIGVIAFIKGLPAAILEIILSLPGYIIGAFAVLAIVAFAAFVGIVTLAWEMAKGIGNAFVSVVTFAWEMGVGIFNAVIALPGQIAALMGSIVLNFVTGFSYILSLVPGIVGGIVGFFMALPGQLLGIALSAAQFVLSALGSIASGAAGIVGQIVGFFLALPGQIIDVARRAAAGFINALADGISSQLGRITSIVKGMVDGVRRLLPGSDAEEGPLSDLTHSGRMLPRTFAMGMQQTMEEPELLMKKTVSVLPTTIQQDRTSKEGMRLMPKYNAPSLDEGMIASLVNSLGQSGQGSSSQPTAPIVVQLVLDQQVLAETMLDINDDRFRRSYPI